MRGYPVGDSELGNKAFYSTVLMKAILLQKWLGIDSDSELENQINDRWSFNIKRVLLAEGKKTQSAIA